MNKNTTLDNFNVTIPPINLWNYAMREKHIEEYLCNMVKAYGGETRKLAYIGRKFAPDRLVMLNGKTAYVELKRPNGGIVAPGQLKELQTLRDHGNIARLIWTKEGVAQLIDDLLNN